MISDPCDYISEFRSLLFMPVPSKLDEQVALSGLCCSMTLHCQPYTMW